MSADASESAGLPEQVRSRIIALAAEVLPQVTPLPPSLKRVADFTPARRARLGGRQIGVTIGLDDEFRGHVATQAAVLAPELAAAVKDGEVPDTADPIEVSALLWLLRPEGWEAALALATERVETRQHSSTVGREADEVERLKARLSEREQALREQRARAREQVETLKAENASLRRKLGEARSAQRTSQSTALEAAATSQRLLGAAETATAAAEAEVRRLRARVAELEAAAGAARRESRAERDDSALRARLLMDTLLESAQGLRRELSLPAVPGAPGDRLEAELAADEPGVRSTSAAGTLGPSSPALLENYLAMPRARLIVDGYNVSKSAWPESSLEAQRIRLLAGIAPLVARSGAETTVVFDAAASGTRPPVHPPRGVKVIFSPLGVIADDVIRDLVAAEPQGRLVVVVTSDQEVVRDVRRLGARTAEAAALIGVLTR
ncbi:NYN domain-containing protein [Nocardioides sp.]|uniref:NYN domain-containing protein n=1 Tax=Nocardioides sp. TaxID=35761 RepID=UPI003D138DAC